MSTRKAASRYTSYDSLSPSSSTEFKSNLKNEASKTTSIVKPTHNNNNNINKEHNFSAMVKKFMEKRSNSSSKPKTAKYINNGSTLMIPADFIAQDLKKSARKASNFSDLPKKLFGNGNGNGNGKGSNSRSRSGSGESEKKVKALALTEVKTNTRSLAMVLRSERELLNLNKDQQTQISDLNSLLQERNVEVEKLKNLCLKQREEIKALKSAILFPDEMNCQLQHLLDKQGLGLGLGLGLGSQTKQTQVIPTLQRQISSLTGQLQCLSQDLAQVKAVKYTANSCMDANFASPTTPIFDQQHPAIANSLDFSDDDTDPDPTTTPHSPDDMLLKDVNPCLTPCYSKIKSKEYGATECDYAEQPYQLNRESTKLSRSSDQFTSLTPGTSTARPTFRRSDESKYRYRKLMDH